MTEDRTPRRPGRSAARPELTDAEVELRRRAALASASRVERHAGRGGNARGRQSGALAIPRAAIAGIALLLVLGGIAFGVWATFYKAAVDRPRGIDVSFTVKSGESAGEVADALAKAGVVANANMFRIVARSSGKAAELLPGDYQLMTGMSYDEVVRLLVAGPQIRYVTFTIPEGWGIDAIAERVHAKFGIPAADFADLAKTGAKQFDYPFLKYNPTKTLEGYLFPKTYTLETSATATDVINVMLAQYGRETAQLDYSYAASKNLTPHDVLTIASIIEREASVASDRPKVASVIYNRLHIGMHLQLDSTVQYALNGKANLTLDDLQYDSPYNTYRYAGLPPGPICNPGLVAIQAVLKPATTNYLYYILTRKDGRQSFTASYAEFLRLKANLKAHGLQ